MKNLSISLRALKDKTIPEIIDTRASAISGDVQIGTVFGFFIDHSKMYGGRVMRPNSYNIVSETDLVKIENLGYKISIAMSNNYYDGEIDKTTYSILNRLHKDGNSVICTNDDFAGDVRKTFPKYKLIASAIKNLNTDVKINTALELYDYAVVPASLCDNSTFLASITNKDRVILFANAWCSYSCPDKTCYDAVSKSNRGEVIDDKCFHIAEIKKFPYKIFDLTNAMYDGFIDFKVVVGSEEWGL